MKFRTRYHDAQNELEGQLTAIDFTGDPGKTVQEPAEDADINILMQRMGVRDGGVLPHFDNPQMFYGDFTNLPDTPQEMADILYHGELAFRRLPATVRQRYRTPEELFTFMNDPENYDEAVKIGLLAKKVPTKAPDDTVVSSSTSRVKEPLVPTSQPSKEELTS